MVLAKFVAVADMVALRLETPGEPGRKYLWHVASIGLQLYARRFDVVSSAPQAVSCQPRDGQSGRSSPEQPLGIIRCMLWC